MSKPTLKDLEQQVGELTEALQRERADAENMRRRHDEQMTAVQSMVKAQVVEELLPAIDNLERSLKHTPKELENSDYAKGVQASVKHFEKVLNDIGVMRIKTVGEVFDPALHEAVAVAEPSEDSKSEDGEVEVVCEELQSGYRLGDTVIRHAMVKVKKEARNG